jgi:hypothetical protein
VADSLDEAKAAFTGGVAAQALKWQTRSTSSDSDKVSMLGTHEEGTRPDLRGADLERRENRPRHRLIVGTLSRHGGPWCVRSGAVTQSSLPAFLLPRIAVIPSSHTHRLAVLLEPAPSFTVLVGLLPELTDLAPEENGHAIEHLLVVRQGIGAGERQRSGLRLVARCDALVPETLAASTSPSPAKLPPVIFHGGIGENSKAALPNLGVAFGRGNYGTQTQTINRASRRAGNCGFPRAAAISA